jgi:hypothetical protein
MRLRDLIKNVLKRAQAPRGLVVVVWLSSGHKRISYEVSRACQKCAYRKFADDCLTRAREPSGAPLWRHPR